MSQSNLSSAGGCHSNLVKSEDGANLLPSVIGEGPRHVEIMSGVHNVISSSESAPGAFSQQGVEQNEQKPDSRHVRSHLSESFENFPKIVLVESIATSSFVPFEKDAGNGLNTDGGLIDIEIELVEHFEQHFPGRNDNLGEMGVAINEDTVVSDEADSVEERGSSNVLAPGRLTGDDAAVFPSTSRSNVEISHIGETDFDSGSGAVIKEEINDHVFHQPSRQSIDVERLTEWSNNCDRLDGVAMPVKREMADADASTEDDESICSNREFLELELANLNRPELDEEFAGDLKHESPDLNNDEDELDNGENSRKRNLSMTEGKFIGGKRFKSCEGDFDQVELAVETEEPITNVNLPNAHNEAVPGNTKNAGQLAHTKRKSDLEISEMKSLIREAYIQKEIDAYHDKIIVGASYIVEYHNTRSWARPRWVCMLCDVSLGASAQRLLAHVCSLVHVNPLLSQFPGKNYIERVIEGSDRLARREIKLKIARELYDVYGSGKVRVKFEPVLPKLRVHYGSEGFLTDTAVIQSSVDERRLVGADHVIEFRNIDNNDVVEGYVCELCYLTVTNTSWIVKHIMTPGHVLNYVNLYPSRSRLIPNKTRKQRRKYLNCQRTELFSEEGSGTVRVKRGKVVLLPKMNHYEPYDLEGDELGVVPKIYPICGSFQPYQGGVQELSKSHT